MVGSPYDGDNNKHQQEALDILDQDLVYKYSDYDAWGAHDFGVFKNLQNIRKNAVVIIDNKRFHVDDIFVVPAYQTSVLEDGPFLFSCTNQDRDRLIVKLR